ncbi:sulfotransferase [Nocardiopsis sp. NPDC058631]|uniref:sulfotransferase n=1 Tax=Nocardiopsis sp. NPDC058631 TaxID=3346566 RepID=UPI003656A6DC
MGTYRCAPRSRTSGCWCTGEGWERLCAFLGTEVPEGPFPHLDDTAAMLARQEPHFGGGTAV